MKNQTLIIDLLKRIDIIRCIANGGASKREIAMEIPDSNSTISRAIRNFESEDVIHKDGDNYIFTNFGRIVYKELKDMLEMNEQINEAKVLIDYLPRNTSFPNYILDDATITRAELPNPAAPRSELKDIISNNSALNCITTTISHEYINIYKSYIDSFDSIVLDKRASNYLSELQIIDIDECRKINHGEIYFSDKYLGFILICNKKFMWMGFHDKHGQLKGSVYNKSSKAIEWAHKKHESYISKDVIDNFPIN